MKHIKLFEAFESNILSKTLGYLDKESKKDFMDKISKFCTKIDIPKSKLTDDYCEYLPFNSALKKVLSAEDKVEDCKAKSEEVFGDKGIKDDVCTGGKLKRIWGTGKRNVDCPKCLGIGKIKFGESDAPEGYELIKFWVNDKKDIVNVTVTDGKAGKVASNSSYVGYGKIYQGSYYPGRRDNIDDIPHLSKVLIQWRENDSDWLGTIYHDGYNIFVIHENRDRDGSTPDGGYRQYGRYGWNLSDMDVYKIQMCKEKEPDGEINYYLYNKLADSDLNSSSTPSSTDSLDGSQFAIVFDTGKLKKSEYTKRTDIIGVRSNTKRGLIRSGGQLGLTNDAIKRQNLDKYIKALATKDIKGDISDLTSLDNYIFRILGGKNLIFKMLKGETGDVVKVIESFFKMLKVNKGYKTTGIKNTLITLFDKSIKENQSISNEIKSFFANNRISAFDKQILRSVLSVSELIYEKLKSFGKIENLMDAELILQKIKTINDVITNSRWDFYYFIKGKKDVFDFKSGTRTKEGSDKFSSKLSHSVEEIKNLINKI